MQTATIGAVFLIVKLADGSFCSKWISKRHGSRAYKKQQDTSTVVGEYTGFIFFFFNVINQFISFAIHSFQYLISYRARLGLFSVAG